MKLKIILSVCFFLLVSCGARVSLLLHPTTHPIQTTQTRKLFPFQGGQLEILTERFCPVSPCEPEVFVLEFIGNGSRADYGTGLHPTLLSLRPTEVWTVNYPGYGKSTGPASLGAIPPSAELAFREISKVSQQKPLFLFGTSMGTTAALYLAARTSPAGILLMNPPPLRRLIMGRFGWWNLWLGAIPVALTVPKTLDSIENAKLAKAPMVMLTAEKDSLVLPKYQKMIFDAYEGTKKHIIMSGADHNTPMLEASAKEAASFFSQ